MVKPKHQFRLYTFLIVFAAICAVAGSFYGNWWSLVILFGIVFAASCFASVLWPWLPEYMIQKPRRLGVTIVLVALTAYFALCLPKWIIYEKLRIQAQSCSAPITESDALSIARAKYLDLDWQFRDRNKYRVLSSSPVWTVEISFANVPGACRYLKVDKTGKVLNDISGL